MRNIFLAIFILAAAPLFAAEEWKGVAASTIVFEERPIVLTEKEYNQIAAVKEGKAILEELGYKKARPTEADIDEYSGYKNRLEQREIEKLTEQYINETDPAKKKALSEAMNNFKFSSYNQKADEVGQFIYKTNFETRRCAITSIKRANELNLRDYEVAFNCSIGKEKGKVVKYGGDKSKILNRFYFNIKVLDNEDREVLPGYEALRGQVFNDKTVLYLSPRN